MEPTNDLGVGADGGLVVEAQRELQDAVMFEEVDLFDTALMQSGHGDIRPASA